MKEARDTKKKHGVFTVFSWIFTTLTGAYAGAIVADFIPAPKEVLCKLSLGYCPDIEIISFLAVDADRIQRKSGVGQSPGEDQIGMLHNNVAEQNAVRPNMVEYGFNAENSGKYLMEIYYASDQDRIVDEVIVNDIEYKETTLGKKLGGWDNDDRDWTPPVTVILNDGENTIVLSSKSIFPHLSKIKFSQVID